MASRFDDYFWDEFKSKSPYPLVVSCQVASVESIV